MLYKQLHHFIALTQELNFSRAAERVHLTQSAFSRSIQNLEKSLEAVLVNRQTNQISLTPIGELVLIRAKELVLDVNSLKKEVELLKNYEIGNVTFGAGPFPSVTLLGNVISKLSREHPNVSISLTINNWVALVEQILEEKIEFAVADVRDITYDSRLKVTPLIKQMIAFACHPNHPILSKHSLQPRDLLDYPLVTPKIPQGFLVQMRELLQISEHDKVSTITCDNPHFLAEVSKNSNAIVMSSYAALAEEIKNGKLKTLLIPKLAELSVSISLISLEKREPSPAAIWIKNALIEHTLQLQKSQPTWWKEFN